MNSGWLLLGAGLLLIGLAILVPSNTLTGHIVQSNSCKGIGCVELCDIDAPACGEGLSCCPTQWNTGVCDYEVNCEKIREYSLYQSLEMYQDSVREQPAQIDTSRFIIPLLLTLGILVYFIFKRNDPTFEARER